MIIRIYISYMNAYRYSYWYSKYMSYKYCISCRAYIYIYRYSIITMYSIKQKLLSLKQPITITAPP